MALNITSIGVIPSSIACCAISAERIFLDPAGRPAPALFPPRPAAASARSAGTCSFEFNSLLELRILFLDKRNQIIADEVQQEGTVDHTPVYVREVVKRALELSATAIVLVHNHPSGDPTPSRADIEMTKQIVQSAKNLGIVVHDHIIVGSRAMRALGDWG